MWGYDAFRGEQAEIIDTVVRGGDALVLMPTGGGKSLCYQVPALVRQGTGVVVSPLIALMQDQVDALSALGVRAGFLNSTQQSFERRAVEDAYLAGELDLLYLAPERLRVRETIELLDRGTIALFAIDEAHCVSQWGHDFRPDYLQLSMLHERWPEVPRIALTATATEQTHAEIAQRLQLGDARHFVASFDRPNIQYRIAPKDKPRDQLLSLLRTEHEGDAGIVYCLSRNSVEQTAQFLVDHGVPALPYHAGLDRQVRARNQSRFLREDGIVMVATIAFGMGIDKPDVRFVAHLDLPKSVEGYYQETGRAGRDGLPSTAWLAYGLADVVQQRRMIDTSEGDAAHKRRLTAHLDAMLALCETVVVPARAAAQLLRSALGAVRELRHVPDAAGVVGRDRGRAEAALDGRAARAARPAVRRGAPGRHPARQGDAAGHAARAPVAVDVRRRQGPVRRRVARGGPAAARPRAARGGQRRLRHPAADARTVPTCCAGPARSGCGARPRRSCGRAGRARAGRPPPPTCPTTRSSCSRCCGPGGPASPRSRACPRTWCSTTRRCARWSPSGRRRCEQLGGISGIGAAKLERHGPGLLAALAGVGEPA